MKLVFLYTTVQVPIFRDFEHFSKPIQCWDVHFVSLFADSRNKHACVLPCNMSDHFKSECVCCESWQTPSAITSRKIFFFMFYFVGNTVRSSTR